MTNFIDNNISTLTLVVIVGFVGFYTILCFKIVGPFGIAYNNLVMDFLRSLGAVYLQLHSGIDSVDILESLTHTDVDVILETLFDIHAEYGFKLDLFDLRRQLNQFTLDETSLNPQERYIALYNVVKNQLKVFARSSSMFPDL
jgi:hypothetical protein